MNHLLTTAAALAAVLALVACVGRVARAGGWARSRAVSRQLVLRDTLALDPRRRLHLVECDGERILVLTGGGSDVLVRCGERARQLAGGAA